MVQGDEDWLELALMVAQDDSAACARFNLGARPEHALWLHLGPVPFVGALTTAPVVMLLAHADCDESATPQDYAFVRAGWPLSALHPEAPQGVRDRWTSRTAELIGVFGAQHVSNSIAALFLTPWRTRRTDRRVRLPSRSLMLSLARSVAARDAILVLSPDAEQWLESDPVATLPATRLLRPSGRDTAELTPGSLGATAWDQVCRQIDVHAWL